MRPIEIKVKEVIRAFVSELAMVITFDDKLNWWIKTPEAQKLINELAGTGGMRWVKFGIMRPPNDDVCCRKVIGGIYSYFNGLQFTCDIKDVHPEIEWLDESAPPADMLDESKVIEKIILIIEEYAGRSWKLTEPSLMAEHLIKSIKGLIHVK